METFQPTFQSNLYEGNLTKVTRPALPPIVHQLHYNNFFSILPNKNLIYLSFNFTEESMLVMVKKALRDIPRTISIRALSMNPSIN